MLDVIVLTAFGKENWLLSRLQEEQFDFVSIDVTDFFVARPVPFTVPFGTFLTEGEESVLKDGPIFNRLIQGWCLLSDEGAVETNGLLQNYHASLRGDFAKTIFAQQFSTSDQPGDFFKERVELSFSTDYVVHELVKSPLNMCLQPEQNFSIHLREGAQKVTVGEDVYMAPYLVNLLDPYMCRELQSRGVDCSSLAHSRKMDPIYIWQPFYAKTSGGEHLQALPKQTVLAANLFTPLIEEQMLIVNKEASGNEFVVWSKIIFDLRKNKKYLDAIKMKIASSLKKRLFLSDVEVGESFIGAEQGISPFPIYDASEVQLYKKWYDRGVFHGGFEVCNNMGLNEQLRVQKNILKGLTEESERDRQIYA